MGRKEPKRPGGSDQNKAIARWDNEGGAPKRAPQEHRNALAALAKEEEHILRCLGAAVIMQWNDLPADVQRELFDHAISMGELRNTAELKGQIARFLRKHQTDNDRDPGSIPKGRREPLSRRAWLNEDPTPEED
jgi:hypothetical protein